jgi:hypothetical protein
VLSVHSGHRSFLHAAVDVTDGVSGASHALCVSFDDGGGLPVDGVTVSGLYLFCGAVVIAVLALAYRRTGASGAAVVAPRTPRHVDRGESLSLLTPCSTHRRLPVL